MVIWRGWGILAFIYAALAMIVFAGVASTLIPESSIPFSVAIGLSAAAIATWFTGREMNQASPRRKIDIWEYQRMTQLDELVESGRFSLGPGQPQPLSLDEAQEMADNLLEQEKQQTKTAFNRHTLFWVPMQYFAFVWAAIALFALISGIIGTLH